MCAYITPHPPGSEAYLSKTQDQLSHVTLLAHYKQPVTDVQGSGRPIGFNHHPPQTSQGRWDT